MQTMRNRRSEPVSIAAAASAELFFTGGFTMAKNAKNTTNATNTSNAVNENDAYSAGNTTSGTSSSTQSKNKTTSKTTSKSTNRGGNCYDSRNAYSETDAEDCR